MEFFQASYGNTLKLLYPVLGKLGGILIFVCNYNLHQQPTSHIKYHKKQDKH